MDDLVGRLSAISGPSSYGCGRWGLVTVDGELFGDTLPTYLTRFVGRDLEIRAVEVLMRSSRLVTVCGVGGAGKTRLAIEVARRHRSAPSAAGGRVEVYWVPLGAVTDAAEVSAAVATGVGLTGSLGARAASVLVSVLSDRRVLLVFDNCAGGCGLCGVAGPAPSGVR